MKTLIVGASAVRGNSANPASAIADESDGDP